MYAIRIYAQNKMLPASKILNIIYLFNNNLRAGPMNTEYSRGGQPETRIFKKFHVIFE